MKIYQIAIPLILLDVLSPVGPTECSCSGSHHSNIPDPLICPVVGFTTEQTTEMDLLSIVGTEEIYIRAWTDSVTMTIYHTDTGSTAESAKPFTAEQFRILVDRVASCGLYRQEHQCNLPRENKTYTELFVYEGERMTFDGYHCVFGNHEDYTMQGDINRLRNSFLWLFEQD